MLEMPGIRFGDTEKYLWDNEMYCWDDGETSFYLLVFQNLEDPWDIGMVRSVL